MHHNRDAKSLSNAASIIAEDAGGSRAFAATNGLAWQDEGLKAANPAAFQHAIAAGIALLDGSSGHRVALSPSPACQQALSRHDLSGREDIVVMPAMAFRAMMRDAAREHILDEASHGLERRRPGESARQGMSARQGAALSLLAITVTLLALHSTSFALAALAAMATPVFGSLVALRLGAVIDAWTPARTPATPLPDARLPIYTVLVPIYREAAVLRQLIGALIALDYPADRLDIKILVEEGDSETREALAAFALPAHVDILVAPEGEPRTKPRALNIGLMEARGSLVTIYDAEDRPDPRQLRVAANLFRQLPETVACLQGRLVIDNVEDSLLTRFFALEYAALFDVVNAGLIRGGLPVLLGGTSNHFRAGILRKVGGWDAWNVTEDADLAFRLVRNGYSIADLPSMTLEEAPSSPRAWFHQRVRWMKGFLQTLVTHLRQPLVFVRQAGLRPGLTLVSLCAGTLLSMLTYPIFMVAGIAMYTIHGGIQVDGLLGAALVGVWLTLLCGGMIALIAPVLLGARHRGLTDILWLAPAMPIYCLLVSAAAWAGLIEHARAPFRWNKTEHGLAKTSRAGRRRLQRPGTGLQRAAPSFMTAARSLRASGPKERSASASA